MTVVEIVYYFFILMAAAGAAAILLSKNVFRSAVYLLVSLLSIAGLYVMSFAEFLAVTQILIYAGGITVIIIFGIMLTTRMSGKPLVVKNTHVLSGGLIGVSLFILLINHLPDLSGKVGTLSAEPLPVIAERIFSLYTLPFELAGLLLLIALIGAAVITSHLKSKV